MDRKKWKSLASGIAFLVVFCLLFHSVSVVFCQKIGGTSRRIQSFYDEKPQSLDVVCIGSSHAYCSFIPTVLWEEYGLTSYCMGSPSQTVACSYILLKEALQYQTPKVILLETYYFATNKEYFSDIRMQEFSDNLRIGVGKQSVFDLFLPDISWKEKITWLIPLIRYHSRWGSLQDADFHYDHYAHGAKLSLKVNENISDPQLSLESEEVPARNLRYLDAIVKLCQEKQIPLILYQAPMGSLNNKSLSKVQLKSIRTTYYLRDYLAEQNIPVIIGQDIEGLLDYTVSFRNNSHMNVYGGEAMTRYLGEYLTETVGITGYAKSESLRKKWDQDVADYKAWRYAGAEDTDKDGEDDGEQEQE